LLNDYFTAARTVVVATHEVEEIQHVLTDLVFIDRGRIVLNCSIEEVEARYFEVLVHPDQAAAARELKPMHERQIFGRPVMLFDVADLEPLAELGQVRTPASPICSLRYASFAAQPETRSCAMNTNQTR
jgi:ABC-2 type transport system ATP-binding protein